MSGKPEWMSCESRSPLVRNSLRNRANELRVQAARNRKAFKKDWMGVPTRYLADVYDEAAAVFERRLAEIESALPASNIGENDG